MIDTIALILFPALMAYAALSDIFTMTISNWVSLCLVAGFGVLAWACGMPIAAIGINHLACGALVLVITFIFFARGWVGGGDAKLAAATTVWVGWGHLSEYALLSSVFGLALTLGLLSARKMTLPARLREHAWLNRLLDARTGIPYGVALGVAGLVLYPETAVWQTVVGV